MAIATLAILARVATAAIHGRRPSGSTIHAGYCNDGNGNGNGKGKKLRSKKPQRGSNTAIDSTCAVCGNMSMTPAAFSVQPFSLTRKPASRASEAGWQLT